MSRIMSHIIELDGAFYQLHADRVEPVTDPNALRGDRCHVSDLESAVSRVMTIESDARYAPLMVNKKLQEMGEFDEPLTVVPHWTRKKGKNTTEIFFTALPSRRYHQYRDMMKDDAAHFLVFPLYAVLFRQLKKIARAKPVALVFQHGRFADLLIGTGKRVYYANRLVAFDSSEEQIASLWTTLQRDVESVVQENRIGLERLYLMTWVDTSGPALWPEDSRLKLSFLKRRTVTVAGERRELSLPEAVEDLPAGISLAPGMEKIQYRTHRAAPLLNAAMALAAVLVIIAAAWMNHMTTQVDRQAAALAQELSRTAIAQPSTYSPDQLDRTLSFVQSLDDYRNAPAFRKILSDLSGGRAMDMILQRVKMAYGRDGVQVEAYGHIMAPFEEAHKGYQLLLTVLRRKGYRIESERFDTKINKSSFILKVSKSIR